MASSDRNRVDGPLPRREPRLRLACSRCQRRKIRCDGALPCCNNCRKASAECTDGESLRNRNMPRAYMSRQRDRIAWLESIIKTRCPDIDLSQEPPAAVDYSEPADTGFAEGSAEGSPARPLPGFQEPTSTPHTATGVDSALRQPIPADAAPACPESAALSHEIGLVSLAVSQDPKYIGPSSGHLLAKLMLPTSAGRAGRIPRHTQSTHAAHNFPFLRDLMEASHRPVPVSRDQAVSLCTTYFDVIHTQYPILHHPTFMGFLDLVYDSETPDPTVTFQVYMVLAIAATILSRRLKISLPAEGYCAYAMRYFDRLCVENSIQGLQCLLLLLIYTMHSPSMKLNAWYLNYQCIAALIDVGLQRKVSTRNGISLLEQEMRTRIFWVVFTLDRTIATMMGRPIGLRDEACELRLPQDIDDKDFTSSTISRQDSGPSHMSYSIHLFKLAKLNSEIKYVANSIVRDSPSYAYPNIIDVHDWQSGVLRQLDQWADEIPRSESGETYIEFVCNLRYHSLRMLLLRPSPAIPSPSVDSLKQCHHSAIKCLRLFDTLYKRDLLVHSWITFHSLVLSTITMFYCIWVVPEITRTTELDVLTSDLRASLSILSATGEHWTGAKRSRDILDEMATVIIRRIVEFSAHQSRESGSGDRHERPSELSNPIGAGGETMPLFPFTNFSTVHQIPNPSHNAEDGRRNLLVDPFDVMLGGGPIADHGGGVTDSVNIDNIMLDLFDDFIPSLSNLF